MSRLYSCLFVFLFILVMFGCAAKNSQLELSGTHKLDINVNSDTTIVDVKEESIDKEDGGKLTALSFTGKDVIYSKIFSGIGVSDTTRFWTDVQVARDKSDIRKFIIYLNSPGGDAFQGLALADNIKRAQADGFIVEAHASGIIASAAVPIFAVCKPRYAAPNTIFMVHEAALWKWPGRETSSMIAAQQRLMEMLRSRYIGILVDHTTTPFKDWEAMEGKTTWFNVDTGIELGLVDGVK